MTDEQTLAEIRKRDKNYCRSPGVAPYAPDDRRTLLRLLDEARADLDLMCSGVKIGQAATIKSLKAALAAVQAERDVQHAYQLNVLWKENAAIRAERDAAARMADRQNENARKWAADLAAVRAERDAAYEALKWLIRNTNAASIDMWLAENRVPPAVAAVLEKVRAASPEGT